MATKSKTKEEVRQEQVETSVSKFEQFYEKYKNIVKECYPELVWGLSGEA